MAEGNLAASNIESDTKSNEDSMSSIQEDAKEGEGDDDIEGLPTYPYERLTILSMDPIKEIDVTRREVWFQMALSLLVFWRQFNMY